jgi:hypothetical protein
MSGRRCRPGRGRGRERRAGGAPGGGVALAGARRPAGHSLAAVPVRAWRAVSRGDGGVGGTAGGGWRRRADMRRPGGAGVLVGPRDAVRWRWSPWPRGRAIRNLRRARWARRRARRAPRASLGDCRQQVASHLRRTCAHGRGVSRVGVCALGGASHGSCIMRLDHEASRHASPERHATRPTQRRIAWRGWEWSERSPTGSRLVDSAIRGCEAIAAGGSSPGGAAVRADRVAWTVIRHLRGIARCPSCMRSLGRMAWGFRCGRHA